MSKHNPLISIIVPVHNEEANLEWHHNKIKQHMARHGHAYELVYVDDGSRDSSAAILTRLTRQDRNTHYLSFTRNFGKEAATSAGLERATGDVAIMLDADGQHPIELIEDFLAKWHQGFPVVVGVRISNTHEGMVKKYGSKLFYHMLKSITSGEIVPRSTDFRLIDRRVIDEFVKLTEHNRITRGLIDWLGFKHALVEFVAPARHSGDATYTFNKLLKLALSAFVSQTTKPLQFTGVLGFVVMLASAILGVGLTIEKYVFGDPLGITNTALLALFVSFLVGLTLISNWLLALYIENIHNETQNRPLYIIDHEE